MENSLKSEIQKFFKGEVEDSDEVLNQYSRDASVFVVRPQVVVFPKDHNDVKALVKWVAENKIKYPELSITARCAGTDMSGGAIGESIIMDFTRHMNKLISFELASSDTFAQSLGSSPKGSATPSQKHADSANITVQPGMFYRDFEKITLEKGLILPCYTASKTLNAMGGMYGNNSAGERTLKYGKTEDYIVEAKVVFADGNEYIVKPLSQIELQKKIMQLDFEGQVYKNIYELIKNNEDEINLAKPKVSKNSAGYYIWNVVDPERAKRVEGYIKSSPIKNSSAFLHPTGGTFRGANSLQPSFFDLNRLLVGSQGTLGITTEITFRLEKEEKYRKLVAIFMKDLGPLGRLVDEILEMNPETLEAYDDKTMKLAVQFFPDFLKNKGFVGMIKFMWSFLPELWMMITGGFPKLILLAEFSGENEKDVHLECMRLKEKISHFRLKTHITKNETEAGKYWDIRRQSFALLRKHVKDKHTAPFIDDIVVRPEFLPKFIPELNIILSQYDITYTIAGHAGDGNFHIIPLMDFSRTDTKTIILELSEKVYDLVARFHGSITAEHNDGIIRTPYLNKMYSSKILEIFKEIKNIFDPNNFLNPGKKVGGSKDYLANHIVVEQHGEHES